jgi:hypothetical protein
MRRLVLVIVCGAVLVGVAGTFVALRGRGGEEAFKYEQSGSLALKPSLKLGEAQVAAFVATAPEPVIPADRTPPVQANCTPRGGGTLRNPWSCTILYRSGRRVSYRVVVQPNGHYTGVGPGIISGCCVAVPTLN